MLSNGFRTDFQLSWQLVRIVTDEYVGGHAVT